MLSLHNLRGTVTGSRERMAVPAPWEWKTSNGPVAVIAVTTKTNCGPTDAPRERISTLLREISALLCQFSCLGTFNISLNLTRIDEIGYESRFYVLSRFFAIRWQYKVRHFIFQFFFYLTTLRSLMELFMNGTFIFLKNLFPLSLFSFI